MADEQTALVPVGPGSDVAQSQGDSPLSQRRGQRVRPWNPSKRQKQYLDAWLDPAQPKTVQALAAKLSIPRETVYYWLRHPQFQAWFAAECSKVTEHLWQPALLKTAALAIAGSAEHFKLLAQVRGELQPEGTGTSSTTVNVVMGIPRAGDQP